MKSQETGRSNFLRNTLVGAVGVAGLAFIADRANLIDINILPDGIGAETQTDIESSNARIDKISPIDFGSFVLVESGVEVTGHQRRVINMGLFSKTTRTNTTFKELRGDAELGVDNSHTEIDTSEKGKLHVTIGELEIHRPRVTEQDTKSGVAFGQRINDIVTNGSDKRDEVADKLVEVGTNIIGRMACAEEATKVAQEEIREHYEKLGSAFGYLPGDITITYKKLPTPGNIPEGRLDDKEEKEWDLADDLDVDVSEVRCSAVVVPELTIAENRD